MPLTTSTIPSTAFHTTFPSSSTWWLSSSSGGREEEAHSNAGAGQAGVSPDSGSTAAAPFTVSFTLLGPSVAEHQYHQRLNQQLLKVSYVLGRIRCVVSCWWLTFRLEGLARARLIGRKGVAGSSPGAEGVRGDLQEGPALGCVLEVLLSHHGHLTLLHLHHLLAGFVQFLYGNRQQR